MEREEDEKEDLRDDLLETKLRRYQSLVRLNMLRQLDFDEQLELSRLRRELSYLQEMRFAGDVLYRGNYLDVGRYGVI